MKSLPVVLTVMLALFLSFMGAATPPSYATSYVMVSDADLLDESPLVAEVLVTESHPAPIAIPFTDYGVEIQKVIKGETASSYVVVRVVAGVGRDGTELIAWGAPRFRQNERAIMFLTPHTDGTYRIVQFLLGAFHEVVVDGQRLAVRDLSEAHEVREPSGTAGKSERHKESASYRDFGRFTSWLSDRAMGSSREAGYFVQLTPKQTRAIMPAYSFWWQDNLKMRWFEFDQSKSVEWYAHASGQPGLSGGGFDEFQKALDVWVDDPNTTINYVYRGTKTGGISFDDNTNILLFEDPFGLIGSPYNCQTGGIGALALSTVTSSNIREFRGERYYAIIQTQIFTNKGLECHFAQGEDRTKLLEEILTHEVGHTLGLGHSVICRSNLTHRASAGLTQL